MYTCAIGDLSTCCYKLTVGKQYSRIVVHEPEEHSDFLQLVLQIHNRDAVVGFGTVRWRGDFEHVSEDGAVASERRLMDAKDDLPSDDADVSIPSEK